MTTVDLAKIEALIAVLSKAGFDAAADQLQEAVHQTSYRNTSDMFGEIGVAIRAAMHLVGPSPAEEIASTLAQARREIAKIVPMLNDIEDKKTSP